MTELTSDKWLVMARAAFVGLDTDRPVHHHHIESYNYAVLYSIPEITKEYDKVFVEVPGTNVIHVLRVIGLQYLKPQITENSGHLRILSVKEAIQRKLSYEFTILNTFSYEIYERKNTELAVLKSRKIFENVPIAKVPALVGSVVCNGCGPREIPGTYVINGNIKIIIAQQILSTNIPVISFPKKGDDTRIKLEFRARHVAKLRSPSTLYIHLEPIKKQVSGIQITVMVPFVKCALKISSIYSMLTGLFGAAFPVDDIADMVANSVFMTDSDRIIIKQLARQILSQQDFDTEAELCNYACTKSGVKYDANSKFLVNILNSELLPNTNDIDDSNVESVNTETKMKALAELIAKMLLVFIGTDQPSDMDNLKNKSIETDGQLLVRLYRQMVRNHFKNVQVHLFKTIQKNSVPNIVDMVSGNRISGGLRYAFSTGNWKVSKGFSNQSGVCQLLNTTNYATILSQMKQVNSPVSRDGKNPAPRQLRPSHYRILCPSETPEGRSVGLLTAMTSITQVRVGSSDRFLLSIVNQLLKTCHTNGPCVGIVINGTCRMRLNMTNPDDLVAKFNYCKRTMIVPENVDCFFDPESNRIVVDGIQCGTIFPIIKADRKNMILKLYRKYFHDPFIFTEKLKQAGVLEFVGKFHELQKLKVAMFVEDATNDQSFTHIDLHPSISMFSVVSSMSPYCIHNPGPRNVYASIMGKQAISAPLPFNTSDIRSYSLNYPQKPLSTTFGYSHFGIDDGACTGNNVVICIGQIRGFGQEDAFVFNKDALDRGLLRRVCHQTFRETASSHGTDKEIFCNLPENVIATRQQNQVHIDIDGTPKLHSLLRQGDTIIGKCLEFSHSVMRADSKQRSMRDRSLIKKSTIPSRVDSVMKSCNTDGKLAVTVKLIENRVPAIGDKFASRHGQKGTIGLIVPSCDLPRTADGIIPDIFVNSHAYPSRQTVGELLEMITGKSSAMLGYRYDTTAWCSASADELVDELKKAGFAPSGKERMYCGITGELMDNPCTMGICYFNSLKHIAADKAHARGIGRNKILTRQPEEGRSRAGGQRLGEMEADCFKSHGCSALLIDRLLLCSDAFETLLCNNCGGFADAGSLAFANQPICRVCKNSDHIKKIRVPYAAKLLFQELQALLIDVKLKTH